MKKRSFLILFWCGLFIAGVAAADDPPTSGPAALRSLERGSWKAILKAHQGEPTIVHFWGLTCGPCRTEMPLWGAWLKNNPTASLVTINADLVQNAPEMVEDFLGKSGLSLAENWTFDDNFVERLRFEVDPQWQGEIPFTLLIGPEGAIRRIDGVADLAEISAWLSSAPKPSGIHAPH